MLEITAEKKLGFRDKYIDTRLVLTDTHFIAYTANGDPSDDTVLHNFDRSETSARRSELPNASMHHDIDILSGNALQCFRLPSALDVQKWCSALAPGTVDHSSSDGDQSATGNTELAAADLDASLETVSEATKTGRCGTGFAYCLAFISLYNLVKIPFFLVLDPATAVHNSSSMPFGMQNAIPLYYVFDYHGSKQAFDPVLFLAPHTMMGVCFFVLSAAYLLGHVRFEPMLKVFFPMTIIFCIHTIPCRKGLSNRLSGWPADAPSRYERGGAFSPGALPINEACLVVGFLCSCVGIYFNPEFVLWGPRKESRRALWWCWAIILADMFLSPFADVFFVTSALIQGKVGNFSEGPLPSPHSGKGFYAGCGCPVFGILVALTVIGAVAWIVGRLLKTEREVVTKDADSPKVGLDGV